MRSPEPAGTGSPFHLSLWIGVSLILFGLTTCGSIQHWIATRNFLPVDMPVSLASSHIKTRPFRINLKGWYSIWIDLDQSVPSNAGCNSYSSLQTRWTLYRSGQVAAKWDYPVLSDTYLEGFRADEGTYELEVEVVSDASCLNPAHPRLRVNTGKRQYAEEFSPILWLSVLFIGAGLGLLVLFGITRCREQAKQVASLSGSQNLAHFQWSQKFPLKPAFSGLPSFGLMCALGLSWLVMFHMLFYQWERFRTKGIPVDLMSHIPPLTSSDRWNQPLVLRVESAGRALPTKLYLNSTLLAEGQLNDRLKAELSYRSVWVVYVEADTYVPWQDVLQAIDAVRGLHAKVVLLTSRTEAKQR